MTSRLPQTNARQQVPVMAVSMKGWHDGSQTQRAQRVCLAWAMQMTLWFWKGTPLQDSVCQQVSHSAPPPPPNSRAHKPAVLPLKLHDNISAAELEVMTEGVLDRKFLQWKKDIVTDLMGMVTPTIEALKWDIFELREENKILKERFDKQVRDREKEVERENIVSAKVRSVENEQYARRYNMWSSG